MAKAILLCFFLASAFVLASTKPNKVHLSRQKLSSGPVLKHDDPIDVMVTREGYPFETYDVVTEDQYILTIHRIPHGKQAPTANEDPRPVAYLQHGLLSSSVDFVMGSPEKSLGYILADAGFDVWMGNYRGNSYSRNHVDLSPSQNKFWEFSWDQMGEFDIPATIDKILEVSGQEKLFYVGHSMGTTGLLVMSNKRPEYLEKIILASLLAPVAYMEHIETPLKLIAPFVDSIEWVLGVFGLGEFLPNNWFMDLLAEYTCSEEFVPQLCESVLFLLCGFDQAQMNETLLETIIHHTPAGSSTRAVIHYVQEHNSKKFCAYDYGLAGNLGHYGTAHPPEYSLEVVNVPVSAFWSKNDWLAAEIDVKRILVQLPNLVAEFPIAYEKWNHLDYLWGIDANKFVYEPMISKIMEYINGTTVNN